MYDGKVEGSILDPRGHCMRQIIFIMSVGFIFLLVACSDTDEPEGQTEAIPTPVEVSDVETGDFVVGKTIYGKTAPSKQFPVILEQPGEITTLNVKNGDQVNEGDHLATVKTPVGEQSIYATADGDIAQLTTKEGGFQSNEDPLLLVVDVDPMLVHYAVTAKVRELFTADDEMEMDIAETTYEATVTSIDSMPNEAGQYAVELQITNEDQDILPGMPAKLTIEDQRVKDTIILPTEAVLTEEDEQFVFVLRDDHVEKVIVDVQETQSDQTAVEAELAEDDQVVVNGHVTLTDQDKVTVKKAGKES